jgi:hypothetical protein
VRARAIDYPATTNFPPRRKREKKFCVAAATDVNKLATPHHPYSSLLLLLLCRHVETVLQ